MKEAAKCCTVVVGGNPGERERERDVVVDEDRVHVAGNVGERGGEANAGRGQGGGG